MRQPLLLWAALAVSSLSFTACSPDGEEDFCEHFHFAYEGEYGPDRWAECATGCGGTMQSPIDLANATTDPDMGLPDAQFNSSSIEAVHTGHSIMFNMDAGSSIIVEGVTYNLKQVHFHNGSEHYLNGQQLPMEAHLVHTNAAGTHYVVIGVFFVQGQANPFLSSVMGHLPSAEGDTVRSDSTINIGTMFPQQSSDFFIYEGSLTTPPCSETVTWVVLETPAEASVAQIQAISALVPNNHRPLQPLNGRVIRRSQL